MQKVPTILHGNIDHSGGISKESGKMNDIFDTNTASAPVSEAARNDAGTNSDTSEL